MQGSLLALACSKVLGRRSAALPVHLAHCLDVMLRQLLDVN
jgi:hypothetical protein